MNAFENSTPAVASQLNGVQVRCPPARSVANCARVTLAIIRLINGTAALVAPKAMVRRFGVDPQANLASLYVLRLFGVRTVVLGAELLLLKGDRRTQALRVGTGIHAVDATAAVAAGVSGHLQRRAAITGALISSVNTALAIIAQKQR